MAGGSEQTKEKQHGLEACALLYYWRQDNRNDNQCTDSRG